MRLKCFSFGPPLAGVATREQDRLRKKRSQLHFCALCLQRVSLYPGGGVLGTHARAPAQSPRRALYLRCLLCGHYLEIFNNFTFKFVFCE